MLLTNPGGNSGLEAEEDGEWKCFLPKGLGCRKERMESGDGVGGQASAFSGSRTLYTWMRVRRRLKHIKNRHILMLSVRGEGGQANLAQRTWRDY